MISRSAGCPPACIAALTLALAAGCSSAGTPPAPDGSGIDATPLAPYPGWPAEMATRAVGDSFGTAVTKLAADDAGRLWLLRDDWADASQFPEVPVLERYSGDGPLERRVTFDEGALVRDFVVHPSGELTVFVLAPTESPQPPQHYRLDLLRLSGEGETLARVALDDAPGPGEDLYYSPHGPFELTHDGPPRLGWASHVVGLTDGEGVYLLAWTFGAKLYRLAPDYSTRWSTLVMPENFGMAFNFTPELLALDEDGRIHVTYQIFEEDVAIYNQHFGRSPALEPIDTYDALVERFDPDGAFSAAALFGGTGVDKPTGMVAHRDHVVLTGGVRRSKLDQPNRTLEWDLFALRGHLDQGVSTYATFDLSRDDFAWALVETADGTFYLGGRTDYVQVDTNSEVEAGKGLLLSLSHDFALRTSVTLDGPRDVQVRLLVPRPDGRLFFAGTRDGPLTHDAPSEQRDEGFVGVVQARDVCLR